MIRLNLSTGTPLPCPQASMKLVHIEKSESSATMSLQDRAAVWEKTGIAAMRDTGITELPEELWAVAHALRVCFHLHLRYMANCRHPLAQ